jgi:predicted CXXCH cytochrome family protein
MSAVAWAGVLLASVALLLAPQLARALGPARGLPIAALLLAVLAALGWWLTREPTAAGAPADWATVASVPSSTCAKCHADHYESWHRSYHRTMTRDAAPDTVKGDFDNAVYEYRGLKTWLSHDADGYYMKTLDRDRGAQKAREAGLEAPPVYTKLRVDRLVGSHWVQEYLHREADGTYSRLPVLYIIGEKRWVHSNGAFLAPEFDDFWANCQVTWNDTCLYCHNTGPVKNPQRGRGGYKTQVAELGISCEACHGPGGHHAELNQNPARRFTIAQSREGDPSIVDPLRLPVARRDEICARCHGALVPKPEMWDLRTHRDPFIAGQELTKFNHVFWSEKQQHALRGLPEPKQADGRFWGDGTPLTTALEYNGMALSKCYQNGQGEMSCLSCHQMHNDEPNFLLKPKMNTDEACLQCHGEYRERLTEHTRHAATSEGSRCVSCHMPHVVYSLLTTHRSHRIQMPRLEDSVGTGKPHACNLCHLDKSLGWTRDELAKWPGGEKRVTLTEDEEKISSAILLMTTGDARSRALVAGAFSSPAARKASGSDWFAPFLTRLMAEERYPIVRYLAYRGLRAAHGSAADGYDYMAAPAERAAQLDALRSRLGDPISRSLPHLPLSNGRPDDAVLRRLMSKRNDPDVTINE